MSTPQLTDERLRSWLDGQQLARERLCLAVLGLDNRFANIRPRNPRGGPDGGRDIEAVFQNGQSAWAAVGFQNSVSDSPAERRSAVAKFKTDLQRAKDEDPSLQVFVFFTNVTLATAERAKLSSIGRKAGIEAVEVMDRERIRIALDGPDGLAVRYQYLEVPLSVAEQAAFFSRWGSGIESLITKSISTVEKRLARLEFIGERDQPLTHLSCWADLKKSVSRAELGHFRFEWYLEIVPPKPGIIAARFGSCSDRGGLSGEQPKRSDCQTGISWIERRKGRPKIISRSSGVLTDPVGAIGTWVADSWNRTSLLNISLGELDGGMFAFFMNERLAPLIRRIRITANEYLLCSLQCEEFSVSKHDDRKSVWPVKFTRDELAEPWVRMMSKRGLNRFEFSEETPYRLYHAKMVERDAD